MSVTTSKRASRTFDDEKNTFGMQNSVWERRPQVEKDLPFDPGNASPAHSRHIPRSRSMQYMSSLALPLALACTILLGWYIVTGTGQINSLLLPAPADVLGSL